MSPISSSPSSPIAIGVGSIFTNRLLKGEVSVKYVPIAAILITVFIIDLYFATGSLRARAAADGCSTPSSMLIALRRLARPHRSRPHRLLCRPLRRAALCSRADRAAPPRQARARHRRQQHHQRHLHDGGDRPAPALLLAPASRCAASSSSLGIANAFAALYICQLLPQELIASIARWLFRFLYRVEVKGLENFHAAGRRAVIVANHTSLLDGPLLSAFLPERASFAINTHIAKRWWVKPAFQLFDLLAIDPTNPMALRTLVNELKQGRKVVIFPEGRLTVTGALMKVYEGPGMIAHLAGAKVLPVRIDGAQYSPFSRMRGKLRLQLVSEDHAHLPAAGEVRRARRASRARRCASISPTGSTTS